MMLQQLMELIIQTENKGELLRDDATTIGDDYTSELRTDDATINIVSDPPS